MFKLNHNTVIRDREAKFEVSRISLEKIPVVDDEGQITGNNEVKSIKFAAFVVSFEEVNENNGFKAGDLRVYCRNNQDDILQIQDKFKFLNSEYIIKKEIPLMCADYKIFLARRVVDDN